MPHQITILPSGHTFSAEAYETLLEAGIEAGFNLPYGCRNGTCGTCKGKVVEGSVDYGEHLANTLTEEEKQAGLALFCCARPLTDLVIECREVSANNGVKPRIMPARVQKMEQLSHDVMALFLKLPSNERMQFMAGQYVEFILKDGKRRAFSFANAPHDDDLLEMHLRLIPGGQFTHYVFSEMHEKAILRLEGPFGSFYLREDSTRPIIFVAGGTGFAPIKGIIEHAMHYKCKRKMVLYWGVKSLQDLYMPELPKRWQAANPNFSFIPVLSKPLPEDNWQGRTGLVHQAVLDDYANDKQNGLSDYQIYCCGAPAMVETAHQTFQAQGLPENEFFSDAFSYANPISITTKP
ncbi:MAG TPA: CDP-6-deoxy-delta-3,4-glucoseen reductase [Methylophilaceae bacterium]|nr:CDP-6-deoxy-delta-3,4-glucoseen reductase [Methylophilaceae bacterium]